MSFWRPLGARLSVRHAVFLRRVWHPWRAAEAEGRRAGPGRRRDGFSGPRAARSAASTAGVLPRGTRGSCASAAAGLASVHLGQLASGLVKLRNKILRLNTV